MDLLKYYLIKFGIFTIKYYLITFGIFTIKVHALLSQGTWSLCTCVQGTPI